MVKHTHSNQRNTHDRLLRELAEALTVFRQAMKAANVWQQVVLMTYAEFGRRPAENGSTGTEFGRVGRAPGGREGAM